jgi:ABC transport system ATP-binding/permease protein
MEVEQKFVGDVTIRFLSGPLADKIIAIQKMTTTIGRDKQNDIVMSDQSVSRYHACIRWLNDSWTIENLSQSSYVAIDQQRIIEQSVLQHNSVVNIGDNVSFAFLLQAPAAEPLSGEQTLNMSDALTLPPQPIPSTVAIPEGRLPFNIPLDASPSETQLGARPNIGKPSFTVSSNIHSDVQVHNVDKPVFSIGRNPENDLVIADPIISAWHAQVVREGSDLFFIHPHSSREKTVNGLWYQGQKIRGDQPFRKKLVSNDIFRIGDEHGTLITLIYDDGTGVPVEKPTEMRPIALTADKLTIGRTPDNTVVLNHPQVSGHHAVFEKVTGGYRVTDTNSTNHVYVNGQIVDSQLLRTGDEMRIGPYRLTYTGTELRQYDESSNIRIDALGLKKTGNNNVILLNNISLVIPPRKFVALVGGSGAGNENVFQLRSNYWLIPVFSSSTNLLRALIQVWIVR